ncbi:3-deoxy-manno-octulosonate cytidylyltransferase [Thalassoglobus polymorphus]|uniref:3-deoxy-manno-octulosonate cytidylyltransferase n=1 Tax=Thalassoglobus polymorphus TaxID=2527994 RepID=A0A517QHJ0_9PLAN|nr:3-deoxy-manno-octulosonate cytidylyltransferase [Thalassoglobus polymorphus]QDT31085.1 3-deoxy-manno-octulosonate cytidylyltransferase [Thalassoglobus polymorphus]
MSTAIGIIPARMQSSRLPGKMLLKETGKPLIQYAWEAASASASLSEVIIATDSEEIATACKSFGARVSMTGDHPSGTDRIAEVVQNEKLQADLIINVQGDEPELDPGCIDRLVTAMQKSPNIEMGTLGTPITSQAMLIDQGCVKIVRAADGRALYFSRLPIPFYRDGDPDDLLFARPEDAHFTRSPWLLHLGIYAYRPEFLLALTQMPPSELEQLEKLEQLRALEAGASILVEVVHHRSVGIDTAADYAAFVERMQRKQDQ